MNKIIYNCSELRDTLKLGEIIAKSITVPYFILLKGQLGAGKTTITKFIGKELGVTEIINSPTFVTMNIYQIKNNHQLLHLDGYNLSNTDDLAMYEEQFNNKINIIEWFENISSIINFNEPHILLDIKVKNNIRKVTITGIGSVYNEIANTLMGNNA